MKCRYCGNELEKGSTYCDACERNLAKNWQTIVAVVASFLVVVALGVVLFFGLDLDFLKSEKKTVETTVPTEPSEPAYISDVDYTGTEENVKNKADEIIVSINGAELTNRELQLYYNLEVSEFLSTYYSYLSSMGLDYTVPLNEQKCYYEDCSWEAYFVQEAINTWRQYQLVYFLALEDGFTLSDETRLALSTLPDDLAAAAEEAGYDDVTLWLKDAMMSDITVDEYIEYCTVVSYYNEYITVPPTESELNQYYADYEEYFVANNVGKDAGNMVNVRHILLQPKDGTTDENNQTVYTDEAWAECLKETETVLAEWKAGEATETTFAEFANLYSADGGSNTIGGLYTDITADSSYVEPFLSWAMDSSRRVGDTGIVQTEFGYHIMYFSATKEIWRAYGELWYAQERELDLVDIGMEKWPSEVNLDVVCIEEFVIA